MPRNIARRIWAGLSRPNGIRVRKGPGGRDRFADYAEALALAEAGEQALAGGVIRRGGSGRKRILIVGRGHSFSPRLAEYALGLAQRLEYGLVFLNVGDPGAAASTPQMNAYLRDGFVRRSGEEVRPWLLLATGRGLEAGHVVRFGDTAREVEGLCRDLHRVELILSDPGEGAKLEGRAPSALFTVD